MFEGVDGGGLGLLGGFQCILEDLGFCMLLYYLGCTASGPGAVRVGAAVSSKGG